MRLIWLVACIAGMGAPDSHCAPAQVATCIRVMVVITPKDAREVEEQYPCIVTDSNKLNFDGGTSYKKPSSSARSWIDDLPGNETGAIYLDPSNATSGSGGTGDFRDLTRRIKPYIAGAAFFGSLFAEPLINYHQAALNRNEGVDLNLSRIRGASMKTSSELAQLKAEKAAGLSAISAQQMKLLAQHAARNKETSNSASAVASQLHERLVQLPAPASPTDLSALSGRNGLPAELVQGVSKTIDPHLTVGAVTMLGKSKTGQGLINAVELELKEYDKLDPAVRASSRLRQGEAALRQAQYFAAQSPGLANALFAEGRSARAFAIGEAKVDEVAVWDSSQGRVSMAPIGDAVNRVLGFAVFFGDRTAALNAQIAKAAGGVPQRPPDSALRTTEQIVANAQAQLDSDPIKSLGGLFRARTLLENMQLYGGAFAKLNKWTFGAAKILRNAFSPPAALKDPGGAGKYIAIEVSKKLKDSLKRYSKAVEAGEYATLGIDKVQDLFGSETLAELKKSLQDARDSVKTEAQPLTDLDRVAPTVDLWLLNDARAANEANSKAEISELMTLQGLYADRVKVLETYRQRLEALSSLTDLYARELDSPAWLTIASLNCMTTACAAEVMALGEQLGEVSNLSRGAGEETKKALERYDMELKKIDQLIDAWLLVLPDPSTKGYRSSVAPMRNLREQLP